MVDFAVFVAPLVVGILTGYALRNRWHANVSRATFATILALIFSLGFSIGSNNDVLSSLPRVAWNAFFMAVLAIVFSVALVELAKRRVKLT